MGFLRITGRGIIVKDGNILLIERWRHNLHYFSIPGGGVDPGETLEQTTTREMWEELSVKVTVGRKVYIMEDTDSQHHIFLCDYVEGEPRLHPSSPEARSNTLGKNLFKPRWVAIDQVKDIPLLYWEPMRTSLAHDLVHGFENDVKTIVVQPQN